MITMWRFQDLSEVLFIATANDVQGIPRPLLDRMELMEIPGYTENEKEHIAREHLIPKQMEINGIPEGKLVIQPAALGKLINNYTKEAGVRSLERSIGRICRKTARAIMEEGKDKVVVTSRNISRFLGKERYNYLMANEKDEIGIARGLAWTQVGGDTLQIEVNIMPGKGELLLTGQLGDVMKESAQAGISYIRSVSDQYEIDPEFFQKHDMHVHIPEGAVPKDGPSAGITMATAMLSAIIEKPVRADLAMTGEITLRGRVLPIGGLKEKLLAAKKAGIHMVLVPEKNEPDVRELDAEITDGLQIEFVGSMEQGLPEPGYHIDLPDSVEAWLTSHGVDLTQAANLADYLSFYYYDQETGAAIRRWDLMDQGVYSRDATGNVSRYVYSLSPNQIEGENEGVKVRLQFTDDGNIITTDNIRMEEGVVSANNEMTIYDGGLNQSEIQAVFSAGGDTLVCSVDIGTGHLLVKSVTDEGTSTNEIVTSADTVDANQITAVDNGNVTYYVNDSEVQVDPGRVQLLVDSVSNSDAFDAAMGADALAKVAATDNTLSAPQYEMAYLDLVDTQNGNTVVTLGNQQALTIYWPMPADADEDGAFYLVHYTGMDRESASDTGDLAGTAHTVEKIQATRDGDHLVFTAGSFSPFVLVYEKESSGGGGSTGGGGGGGSRPTLNTEDHYSYIIGYSDGTLQPYGTITRGEVATIFFRLLDENVRDDNLTTSNAFPDVNEDYWANTAISTMARLGVINGRNSGLFDPDANITRAEFAAICARFDDSGVAGVTTFTDTADHWAEDEISRAAALGWIQGYSDDSFRPDQYISRAQAVTMINRVLCRLPEDTDDLLSGMNTWTDCHESDWFYLAIQEATNSHDFVTKDRVYESWTDLNRAPDWSRYE